MKGMFAAADSAARTGFPLLVDYLAQETQERQNGVDIFIIMTADFIAYAAVSAYFRSDILQVIGQNDSEKVERRANNIICICCGIVAFVRLKCCLYRHMEFLYLFSIFVWQQDTTQSCSCTCYLPMPLCTRQDC